jgi:hypothetical protein
MKDLYPYVVYRLIIRVLRGKWRPQKTYVPVSSMLPRLNAQQARPAGQLCAAFALLNADPGRQCLSRGRGAYTAGAMVFLRRKRRGESSLQCRPDQLYGELSFRLADSLGFNQSPTSSTSPARVFSQ